MNGLVDAAMEHIQRTIFVVWVTGAVVAGLLARDWWSFAIFGGFGGGAHLWVILISRSRDPIRAYYIGSLLPIVGCLVAYALVVAAR